MPIYSSYVVYSSLNNVYSSSFNPIVNGNKIYVCKECNLTTTDNLCSCLNCGNIDYIEI